MPLTPADFANEDDNVLFCAIKISNWEQVQSLLNSTASFRLASECDKYGNTPLHAAIGFQAPDPIVLHLLDLCPAAVKVHGSDDWLPVHLAAMWGASSEVVEHLIRLHPHGLDDQGQDTMKGRPPRHFSGRFPHNSALLERSTDDWVALIERETMRQRQSSS
jgi:hypothetical protein